MLHNPITRRATDAVTHPRETVALVGRTAQGLGLLGLSLTQRAAASAVNRVAGLAGSDLRIPEPGSATSEPPPPTETGLAPPPPPPPAQGVDDVPSAAVVDEREPVVSEAGHAFEPETDEELLTPSGIPAADVGHNPDTAETDLEQPDTEPLIDPSAAKAARSEATTMSRAADRD